MGRLKKHIGVLKVLADKSQPNNLKVAIMKHAPNDLVNCVADCCRNVLNGNVTLTPAKKRQLKVHRQAIRMLAAPNVSVQKKKSVLTHQHQKGGFVGTLLAATVPVVVDLLLRRFGKIS
jgi:hypothetical protein